MTLSPPAADHPDRQGEAILLSVIVLAFCVAEPLDRCLVALERELVGVPHEIIVVVNSSSAAIEAVLDAHPDVELLRPSVNLGFGGGCNAGAARSRGAHLAFVNDDAVVHPGWGAALLARVGSDHRIGAVGSLIVDGATVLEAGGRLHDGLHPVTTSRGEPLHAVGPAREVEWVTGCSILVRRAAFDAIGGFDLIFHPAYFEDVDLCLRLRHAGWTIWVEPASVVDHRESSSTSAVGKAALFDRSRSAFLSRWRRDITESSDDRSVHPLALPTRRDRGGSPHLLVIDDLLPSPARGGGLPRMMQHLSGLRGSGFDVDFHPVHRRLDPTDELVASGVRIIDDPFAGDGFEPYDAIIVSRPHNMALARSIARLHPRAPIIYDAEARFAARVGHQIQFARTDEQRACLEQELIDMERIEADIAVTADAIVCISDAEAAWFRSRGATEVHVMSPFPDRIEIRERRPFEAREGAVVLCGWMAGADSPNGDGVRWLASEVLPLAAAMAPGLEVRISGAEPPKDLRHLESSRLRFVGEVDDVAAFLDAARVALVPVRFGAGVKLKTVDALVASLPVVTTTIGAEGIDARWTTAMRIADDPAEFAVHLVSLLTDPVAWDRAHDGSRRSAAESSNSISSSWNTLVRAVTRTRGSGA